MNDPKLMTTEEAAERCRLSPVTLAAWRADGSQPGLRFIRAGRRVLYRMDDLETWLERNRTPDDCEGARNV